MEKSNQNVPKEKTYGNFIKYVRGEMQMTQEELGKEFGVCPLTILRWEQEKAIPSFLNQKQIESFCEIHGIDLTKFL